MQPDRRNAGKNVKSGDEKGLFREWPTPADTVKGFGGNPDKVDDIRWKTKKETPFS